MKRLKNTNFVRAMLIRAAKTAAQTFIGCIGTAVLMSDVNWIATLSTVVLAVIVSIATSVSVGLPEV